ncbi:hypothetical protein MYX07_03445 [Patescibacteria group bacterium AH-259-L07]|nr:hypothetical protein [Patescibacteria group bacterium AH-259-L07]
MKLRIKKIIIPMALLLFMGLGCTRTDTDIAIDFLTEWAVQEGILNEDGSPTLKTAADATIDSSTGDPQTDAALDAGERVVESIKKADVQLDKANQVLGTDPPNTEKALDHVDQATKIRPNDWYIRNQRATLLAEVGRDAQKDAARADKSCDVYGGHRKVECESRVYEHRAQLLEDSIARQIRSGRKVKCTTYELQAVTYDRLSSVSAGRVKSSADIESYYQAGKRAQAQASQPGVTCAP